MSAYACYSLEFMRIKEFNRKYLHSNTVKAELRQFKNSRFLFSFCGDKVAVFRKVSVEPSSSHISLSKKKYGGNRCEFSD